MKQMIDGETERISHLHALHSSGCLKGKARPLSMAAMEIWGVEIMLQSSAYKQRMDDI